MLSRRERDRSLSHRRLVRAAAGDDYTVRLFNPYVFNREKLFPKELDELSNVIKDHRARLGSMREKNDHKNSSHRVAFWERGRRTFSQSMPWPCSTGWDCASISLRIVLFEACSAFTRVTACTLALSPYIVTRYPKASATSLPP